MPSVRIVCTFDALTTAETLARILGAELYDVRISYGRSSMSDLEDARSAREAVVLIWSYDAPGAHYMLEWATGVEPSRLVEIARAPGYPRITRKSPVIDFSAWRGERGGRAWHMLAERLRNVTRALEPAKPPPRRAAMALGLASVAAVGGAIVVRANDVFEPQEPTQRLQEVAETYDPAQGVGGPVIAVEPASVDELTFRAGPFGPRMQPLAPVAARPALAPVPHYDEVDLRDATIGERLNALNPLNQLLRDED